MIDTDSNSSGALEGYERSVQQWSAVLRKVLSSGGVVLGVGNGGSWACISHFLAEISPKCYHLGGLALPLGSMSSMTAISNDFSFDLGFARQLGELSCNAALIVASTSGISPNIVNAAGYAKKRGYTVLALSGSAQNLLSGHADYEYRSQQATTAEIQENHLRFLHDVAESVVRDQ